MAKKTDNLSQVVNDIMQENSLETHENAPVAVVKDHLKGIPLIGVKSEFVGYSESAWKRKFPPSLCDTSLYVPLAKQVASMLSDSADNGILAGAKKVLAEDYTFADGRVPHGVSLDVFTRFDTIGDIAELSEYADVLGEQIKEMVKKMKNKDDVEFLDKVVAKVSRRQSLTPDEVGRLSQFGITLDRSVDSAEKTSV